MNSESTAMKTSEFTEDELAALPQTEQVFEAPELVVNTHDWIQRGYIIEDNCQPHQVTCVAAGIPIGVGNLLIKDKGGYRLVNEVTRQ
jgi:hypothetical protein